MGSLSKAKGKCAKGKKEENVMNPAKQWFEAAALGIVSNELSQGFLQTQPCLSFCSSACGQS